MNKKVLSAILFSALFAGTGTFTSCIDTDEPAGIEDLRGAKAELIRAKVAVEAAKVAEVQANAAYVNAQAELTKAQAQAAVLKAEYEKAIAEAESAAEIARVEAEIAQLKAQTEATIQQTEAAAKQQEVAYEQALLALAQAKASLVGEQQEALEGWINFYDAKVSAYNEAYLAYVAASREYNDALAEVENNTQDDIDEMRQAEKDLAAKKYQLEMEQEYLTKKEAELEKAKAATPSELQTKKAELAAQLDALKEERVALQLEKAEVRNEKRAEYEKYDNLVAAKDKSYTTEVTIPALTVTDWLGNSVKIFSAAKKYSHNNPANYNNAYNVLENKIGEWEGYLFDENDQAWTEAEIIDQKAALAAYEKSYNTAKARWEVAATVYNTVDGSVNMAAFVGYDAVKTAADAFNATLPAYKDAVAAEEAAEKALAAAVKAKNEATGAQESYEAAVEAIEKEYAAEIAAAEKALEDGLKEIDAEIEQLNIAVAEAEADYKRTYADYLAGLVKASAVARAENAIEKAREDLFDAIDDRQDLIDGLYEDLNSELEALYAYKKADLKDAQVELMKKVAEYGGDLDPAYQAAIDAANETLAAAQKTVAEAHKASDKAYAALGKAYTEFKKTIPYAPEFLPAPDYAEFTALNVSLSRAQAKEYVEFTSGMVWGTDLAASDKDLVQNISGSYLINGLTQSDINAILASWGCESSTYYHNYQYFGAFGMYLHQSEQLVRFETALANVESTQASIEALKTALANLVAGYKANEAAIKAANDAVTAQAKVINAFEKVVNDKIAKNQADYNWTEELWMAYASACTDLNDYTSEIELARVVANIESQIRDRKQYIYDMETAVMKAEKALEDWNDGEYSAAENKKLALEDAEYELNVAKTAVEEAKAYLDAAIKALEAVTE